MSKRRQSCSSEDLQAGFQCSKKAKSQASAAGQEPAEPNSDESHRTEQLLHRDSVTPPQRRPVRKRRANQTKSATRGSSKAAPPPLLFCPTQTTSEESSDILHYNPDTALYYPGTDLVIDGWFQPCRCMQCAQHSSSFQLPIGPTRCAYRIRVGAQVVNTAGVVVLSQLDA